MAASLSASITPPRRDVRDRLILALYAQLKAERETREALGYVIRGGVASPEVLDAIAGDPVPPVPDGDVASVEMSLGCDLAEDHRSKEEI